jgi:hypothetical protein
MKNKTLEEKDALLAWAIDKDGGDRLDGFSNRDKVRRLREMVIDADHGQAIAIAALKKGLDVFAGRTNFVADREAVSAMREAVS